MGNVQNISTYDISLSPIKFPKKKYASNGVLRKSWLQNYLTKPLQGAMFKRFRGLIMGVLPKAGVYKVLTCENVSVHKS